MKCNHFKWNAGFVNVDAKKNIEEIIELFDTVDVMMSEFIESFR